ncbi:MAG: alpha-L-fucosidase [Acidobacteriaceae bacterium]
MARLRSVVGRSFCFAVLVAIAMVSQGMAQDFSAAVRKQVQKVQTEDQHGPRHANWQSLAGYEAPDWFRDAKFGIFIHWGVYSVPAFGNEWYSRNMYVQGSKAFEHHVATYGPQSKFGYKDFIPEFRAEHFDPARWVDLFARAGAKYVVPVAEHCDGFPMYDSQFTKWDAARMGPKRDVVGELEKATRARGLHFGVSSHRAEHWWWYGVGMQFDSDVRDPKNAGLYGPAEPMSLPGESTTKEPDPSHLERWLPPNKAFLDDWLARSTELVDKYHPDLIYFDWWIGQPAFKPDLQRFAAYYYDRAAERRQGIVLTYKEEAMPANVATLDVERGKLDTLRLLPWQTDTSVSVKSWGYVKNDTYRNANSLIQELVDVVSKNGNLLLNVGPKSDGTIPEQARTVLLQMGDWLHVNGEAIYGSRPWIVFGEGPTKVVNGLEKNKDLQSFTAQDIRFTTRAGNLYAIAMGWPADGTLLIHTLGKGLPYLGAPVCSVKLLGSNAKLHWEQRVDGLAITLPPVKPEEGTFVFRIQRGGGSTSHCVE